MNTPTFLFTGATATFTGESNRLEKAKNAFHSTVKGTGAVTATILVEVSNNNSTWMTLGTVSLSGTTTASDGFTFDSPYVWIRASVTAVSGTGAVVSASLGY